MKSKYILLAILFLGFLLRTILLDKYPPSLNWDEISHGYNAYSILKTGADEWGQYLPLSNFRAYGDYPLPLNLYITIPFVALFGLTEFAIRFPHAILGTLTLLSIYFLMLAITNNKKLSLFASFLAAISPWYLFTSRFVAQSNLSVFFLIGSMALFFNRSKNKWFLPLSFLSLGLTLFSYHSTRIFSPMLLTATLIVYRSELLNYAKYKSKIFIASISLLIIFFLPLPFILANPESRARANEVFLINQAATNEIIQLRTQSGLPDNIDRLIYNKLTYFVVKSSKNYIDYYSPQFLFLQGGTQYQFSIPSHGLIYWINLPLFYLGLLVLIKKAFAKNIKLPSTGYKLLLVWLLLAPIPASITTERFAVLRSSSMLPLPEILTAFGAWEILNYLKKIRIDKIMVAAVYFIILGILFTGYVNQYFTHYSKTYSWAWQYGYKQVVEYASQNYDKYDAIIFTKKYGEPHEYVLFYNQWDPQSYIDDSNLVRFNQSNWWWVDRFDKYWFINDWQVKQLTTESGQNVECKMQNVKCLLITSPGNAPNDWKKLETINFLHGETAFELYEN